MRGRLRTAWVQGNGWKWVVRRSRWGLASLDARTAADGVGAREWVEMGGEKEALGNERARMRGRLGAREWVVEMGGDKEPLGMSELGCADGCGRRGEWVDMGGEKEPLGMSELGCADGCGRRGCKGVGGNGWGEGAAGDERARMRGRLRTAWVRGSRWKWVGRRSRWGMSERGCADGCGRRGCQGSGWKWVGRRAAGDERARMRGRLRTAWVQKGVGGGNRWREAAAGDERAWMRGRQRRLRTA
eukprot:s816_g18.t1